MNCPHHFDIIIAGGGLAGASLACALKFTGKSVLLVESSPHDSDMQPSFDERTVALTYSSRNIFSALGVWDQIAASGIQPILDIHVSDLGHFGQIHLSCKDVNTEALGYVVPVRTIGNILWKNIFDSPNIVVGCPWTVTDITIADDKCAVTIDDTASRFTVKTNLLVIADGGRSNLSSCLRFKVRDVSYEHSAVLSFVRVDRPHNGRAYERFTMEGPLACLPHNISQCTGNTRQERPHYAVVWSTKKDKLEHRMALNDKDFVDALQTTFGDRAGNFSEPTARKSYQLKRRHVDVPAMHRVLLIGNAAHIVHPVAGQGFNLGLRDVACLAGLLADQTFDTGSAEMTAAYIRQRKQDTRMVNTFTHSLIKIFTSPSQSVSVARNLGLAILEHLPPAKRILLRRTMGLVTSQAPLTSGIFTDL